MIYMCHLINELENFHNNVVSSRVFFVCCSCVASCVSVGSNKI